MKKICITPPLILHVSKEFFTIFLSLILSFTGCSNDDDEKSADTKSQPDSEQTDETETKQTAVFDSVDDAAFTVLRSLTDLTQYDPEKVTDEDGSVSGIETLPDTWSALTFTCDEGFVLDETKETVRSLPVSGFGEALEFFSSIIGESLKESSLTDGRYAWSYSGLGSLTFTKVTGDEDLFATLDVSLSVMPGLTQLRFVSEDSANKVFDSNNKKFYGDPYYRAGDVIKRKKDGTLWICVRPAGGPYHKEYSYWICLNPTGSGGKSIIDTTQKDFDIYFNAGKITNDGSTIIKKYSQKWTYAKKLMTLKTAKAAFHTFASLVNKAAWDKGGDVLSGYANAQWVYEKLKKNGIDLKALHMLSDGKDGPDASKDLEYYRDVMFAFAYGSPVNESNRTLSLNNLPKAMKDLNAFKKAAQVKCIQPFFVGYCPQDGITEYLNTSITVPNITYSTHTNKKFMLSLTDSYDETYLSSIGADPKQVLILLTPSGTYITQQQLYEDYADEFAKLFYYNYADHLHEFDGTKLFFSEYSSTRNDSAKDADLTANYRYRYKDKKANFHVIVSPELRITDSKGEDKNGDIIKPDAKLYESVYVQREDQELLVNAYFDYWNTSNSFTRYIDDEYTNWYDENE